MELPDFLKPENISEPDEEAIQMVEAVKRYQKKFNDGPITEMSFLSDREWIEALNYCVKHNVTIWNYLGEEYDPEVDY